MACTFTFSLLAFCFFLIFTLHSVDGDKDSPKKKEPKRSEKWKKKDITDYSDADMERLLEQWEEDDDPLPEDELPEWKRAPPKIDISKIDTNDPEGVLKMTKKGKTLMLFASVSGDPSEKETEEITKFWHGSLFNANINTQRYVVGQNRVILMMEDGALAWEVKNYLVQQDRCSEVTIDGKSYPGKGADEGSTGQNTKKSKKKTKSEKSSKDSSKTKKPANNDDNKSDRKEDKRKTEL